MSLTANVPNSMNTDHMVPPYLIIIIDGMIEQSRSIHAQIMVVQHRDPSVPVLLILC